MLGERPPHLWVSLVLEGVDAQVVRQALALLAHSATFCRLQGKIMESCTNLVGSAHTSCYSSGGSTALARSARQLEGSLVLTADFILSSLLHEWVLLQCMLDR